MLRGDLRRPLPSRQLTAQSRRSPRRRCSSRVTDGGFGQSSRLPTISAYSRPPRRSETQSAEKWCAPLSWSPIIGHHAAVPTRRQPWADGDTRPSFVDACSTCSPRVARSPTSRVTSASATRRSTLGVRQEAIDRGLVPGLTSTERQELADAHRRIRELEAELEIHRRASELLAERSDPKAGSRRSR